MKNSQFLSVLTILLATIALTATMSLADPLGTAFTYQGRLIDSDQPAEGLYDLQFKLYDAASAGSQIGSDINKGEVQVTDGYLTVELDFGSQFDGNARWLEMGVRPGVLSDPSPYTPLSPRQKITPTPYALHAKTADIDVPLSLTGSVVNPGAVIHVTNTDNGYGVRGYHQDSGNYGYLGGSQYGVYGGGWGNGIGVLGESPTSSGYLGGNGYGAYGRSYSTGNYGYLGEIYGAYGNHNSSGNYGYLGSSGYGVFGKHNSSGNYGNLGNVNSGVYGYSSSSSGVLGQSAGSYGVYGISTSFCGVYGIHISSGNYGYLGSSNYGVYGYSSSGNYGFLGSLNFGVYGYSSSSSGVYGQSASNSGVYGTSSGSSGVYGKSASNYGVYGIQTNSGNYGYFGDSSCGAYGKHNSSGNYGYLGSSNYGVYGYSSAGHAGYFDGKVYVSSNVGIGTTNPGKKLQVDGGDILVKGVDNFTSPGKQAILYVGDENHSIRAEYAYGLILGTWAAPNAIVVKDSTGNVGIGTTAPARNLHVSDVMRLQPRATAPAGPAEGDIYMDSSTHKLMVYDGTTWRACW